MISPLSYNHYDKRIIFDIWESYDSGILEYYHFDQCYQTWYVPINSDNTKITYCNRYHLELLPVGALLYFEGPENWDDIFNAENLQLLKAQEKEMRLNLMKQEKIIVQAKTKQHTYLKPNLN